MTKLGRQGKKIDILSNDANSRPLLSLQLSSKTTELSGQRGCSLVYCVLYVYVDILFNNREAI